jgi:para-aminobenzoate synthetase component 1
MRAIKKITIALTQELKAKLVVWAQQYEEVIWLDSNEYQHHYSNYSAILAVDALTALKTDFHNAFDRLEEYQNFTNDWLFGYLTYDLKNDIEALSSQNYDGLAFPDLYFFQPKKVFLFKEDTVEIQYLQMVDDEIESDWNDILNTEIKKEPFHEEHDRAIKINLRTSKDSYFEKVKKMMWHIQRGDIYEANFCQEFYSDDTSIDPVKSYFHLNEISQPPFAAFLKLHDHYALSASPERYIKKTGTTLLSQPIKGTAKRINDPVQDEIIKNKLFGDPKERNENIMITDLVRNDLSRVASKGSVTVEELCGLYTFRQVHQLITTITCEVDSRFSNVEMIKKTFPMGSMTGVPKISAMKIIEQLEDTKRGLYSGTVGYFTPNGDFDFNVIIRSILYNASKKYVSYSVGGAITSKSILEDEYEECLLKAKAMREVLES